MIRSNLQNRFTSSSYNFVMCEVGIKQTIFYRIVKIEIMKYSAWHGVDTQDMVALSIVESKQ